MSRYVLNMLCFVMLITLTQCNRSVYDDHGSVGMPSTVSKPVGIALYGGDVDGETLAVLEEEYLLDDEKYAGSDWKPLYHYEEPVIMELRGIKHELLTAEQNFEVLKVKVTVLRKEFFAREISLIGMRVDAMEREIMDMQKEGGRPFQLWIDNKLTTLFLQERAALAQIIDFSEVYVAEAQSVLDRILALVTLLNDYQKPRASVQASDIAL